LKKVLTLKSNTFNKTIARHNHLTSDLGFSSWTKDFELLVCSRPHFHAATPSHKSLSQFLANTKSPATIASPQISAAMTFSTSTMKQESVLHDINSQRSFEVLPLKPNGQRKTWVRTTESHPIQHSPGMNRLVEFASRASENMTL
jgi:hypothetical protein